MTLSAQTPARLQMVREILRESPLIDGHNDLPWEFRKLASNRLDTIDLSRDTTPFGLVTDLPRLKAGGVGGQFWSVYVPGDLTNGAAVTAVLEQIDLVHRMIARYPQSLELALTADDIVRIHREGKIASLIGMEGGHSIGNSLGVLRMMYALGARYMTLTHVKNNEWADSATDTPAHHGLTPFGEDVVREMNRIGMLVDLSHVSDETMRAALKISKAPVIFSHSSARALCHHVRDVPDDILKLVARNGGIVMVTFVPEYLTEPDRADEVAVTAERRRLTELYPHDDARIKAALEDWRKTHPDPRKATLLDIADHFDHIRAVAGIDHVGIGSDFEGFHNPPAGMEDVSRYPELLAELLKRGYTEEEVKKVAGQNLLRVLRAAEQTSARLQAGK
ncbi:MAG TPA: dipeptidase [Verrucomicrobiae bacterium]|nr:dipeptidase [Verrucomicrobiae bacterium]